MDRKAKVDKVRQMTKRGRRKKRRINHKTLLANVRSLTSYSPISQTVYLSLTSKEICPSLTMLIMFWFFFVSSSTSPPAPPPPPNPLDTLLPPPPPPGPGTQGLGGSCLPRLHPDIWNIKPGPPGGSTPGLWVWVSR